jgi:hypothetical protein
MLLLRFVMGVDGVGDESFVFEFSGFGRYVE